MPDEVPTMREVAAPKLAERTVYAMAQAGEIPPFNILAKRRIKRTEVELWIDAQPRGGARGCLLANLLTEVRRHLVVGEAGGTA